MKFLLLPFSLLYAAVMAVRNWMFDRGLLSSSSAPISTICVGNLSVGGTGKTPHTEYLLRLLQGAGWRSGMLSRGYGRRRKGYIDGEGKDALEIGDEPWQIMHSCYPSKVCVCENRPEGLKRMLQGKRQESDAQTAPQVVVLDDAYQHRYIQAGLYILLTDYSHPYFRDYVLPAGRLREARCGAKRADIIVVTKCPADLSAQQMEAIRQSINPDAHQQVFFSQMAYGMPYYLFPRATDTGEEKVIELQSKVLQGEKALVVCGIAQPKPFVQHVQGLCAQVEILIYSDHHHFTARDIQTIAQRAKSADIVITTAKDAARLSAYELPQTLRDKLSVQPIEVKFLHQTENTFNQIILDYVTENSTNSRMD